MAKFIRIVNWDRFQHYKDRNPPWIKLHRELLTSHTWVSLDDASRVLAIACMLLAAATGNQIPLDPAYIRRVAYLNQDPDLSGLISTQFVEIVDESGRASTLLASASTLHTNARPETETETETEGEKGKPRPTLANVIAYCQERGNHVDAQKFFDHYEANGWKVGRVAMKDWKAAVRNWEHNRGHVNGNGNRAQQRQDDNLAALNAAFPLDR